MKTHPGTRYGVEDGKGTCVDTGFQISYSKFLRCLSEFSKHFTAIALNAQRV